MRKTKIVATVGPACEKPAALAALILAGVDVLRINASHTTPARLEEWIRLIRRVSRSLRKTTGILVDLQGPRVRTGLLQGGSLFLKKGGTVWIVPGAKAGSGSIIATSCREFPRMIRKGDPVLLDNGLLKLKVLSLEKTGVRCRVMQGGLLRENKGINLPHAPATLPSLTKKDLADLEVAVRHPVDYIALSFVRNAEDVLALKGWLRRRRARIPVIAKIEKPSAVRQIRSVLAKADAIMVARGDLGIEMGVEKIPAVQKDLIEEAHRAEVPVITATEMLETMMEKPRPSRAEVSDVANAVFDGTDAVMLSGETAVGKYPVQAVRTMSGILEEAERHIREFSAGAPRMPARRTPSPVHAITGAALKAAENLRAKAIVVFTLSGKTALLVSLLKPACPILSMTSSEAVRTRLTLLRGVIPLPMRRSASTDGMIRQANQVILQTGLLKRGDPVVVVSGKQALPGARYMAKIHLLGERLISR